MPISGFNSSETETNIDNKYIIIEKEVDRLF